MASEEGQQHPLKIYYIMWIALFVLSGFSYATDFMDDSALRTFLILLFMFMKAGKVAILGPPVAIMVLIWLMFYEGSYIEDTRTEFYGESTFEPEPVHH